VAWHGQGGFIFIAGSAFNFMVLDCFISKIHKIQALAALLLIALIKAILFDVKRPLRLVLRHAAPGY
jgi:hypothetical protein